MIEFKGYIIALLELMLFGLGAYTARKYVTGLDRVDSVAYYWLCFTVLTGFWEAVYVSMYRKVTTYAALLIKTKKSVWTQDYAWYYVCPVLMSEIFYAEYGAWADREYMSERRGDYWSRLIESTHALLCGLCAFVGLSFAAFGSIFTAELWIILAMGCQLMNSILYMGEYFEQCRDKDSVNYSGAPGFPLGKFMSHRLFMWVNIFWTLCPLAVMCSILA